MDAPITDQRMESIVLEAGFRPTIHLTWACRNDKILMKLILSKRHYSDAGFVGGNVWLALGKMAFILPVLD